MRIESCTEEHSQTAAHLISEYHRGRLPILGRRPRRFFVCIAEIHDWIFIKHCNLSRENRELKDQLEHAEVPGAFTGKSSMNIWKRNDPETYRWFMDHYELKETIPFYGEKFLYYIKK